MTEPIDADDGLLRPEINIARLKTEAPVEIRWGGEWYLASFLSLGPFGDVFSCVPITGLSLCVMSVLAGDREAVVRHAASAGVSTAV